MLASATTTLTTLTATTAAAAAATLVGQLFFGRHAAKFQSHADVLANRALQIFKLLLGSEKALGHFILKQGIASGLEFTDFRSRKLNTGVLFLVQLLAAFVHALILKLGGIVIEEALDVALQLLEGGVIGDLLAQFAGLFDNG